MNSFFDIYQSPFSWRYGSVKMRELFSEVNKRKTWRKVWVSLAKAQAKQGLVSKAELADIIKNQKRIDIKKAQDLEVDLKHDLMAEVRVFASQAKIGGGKIHFGATSQDIEDNADILIFQEALKMVEVNLKELIKTWAKRIEENKNLICMAYTHLQPAEPTTLGYRFSFYAQDLLHDLEFVQFIKKQLKGKGLKGAVGNSASYVSIAGTKAQQLEDDFLKDLKIKAFDITSQVYPRKLDYLLLTCLSAIAQSLYKFAFDLRILQSGPFGELAEPFGKKQIGSSAMPFKRNPQTSEKICALARYIAGQTKISWDYAANSLLERTLDDSAGRRMIFPDSFLAVDEILTQTNIVVNGLVINKKNIEKNLNTFGPFSALESILLKSTKNGANRQKIHEILREHALNAYDNIQKTGNNNLFETVANDKIITKFLTKIEIDSLSNYKSHIGMAVKKSQDTTQKIKVIAK